MEKSVKIITILAEATMNATVSSVGKIEEDVICNPGLTGKEIAKDALTTFESSFVMSFVTASLSHTVGHKIDEIIDRKERVWGYCKAAESRVNDYFYKSTRMIWTKLAKKEWLQWVIQSKLLNGTVDSFVEIMGFVVSDELSKLIDSKE